MHVGVSLSVTAPRTGGGGVPVPGAGDPIAVEILSASPIAATAPIQNVNPNGWVAKVTFKDMAIGQTLDPSKISLSINSPGFTSAGAATTVSRTVTGTKALRTPAPPYWTTGEVVAAGTRRMTESGGVSRGYVTVAGGTCGATPPTVSSGSVSDGGVTWTYEAQPVVNYEEQSGADAVVYLAISDDIHTGDTITACTIQAGAYGSSNASTASFLTLTNNSALAQEKPDVVELTIPWQIVTTSIRAEIGAMHPFGRDGRTLACAQFRIVDSGGSVVLTPAALTAMTRSTLHTGGNIIQCFGQTIDISSLADGLYSLEWDAYPFRGASLISSSEGYGSSTPTAASAMTANIAKRIPFRKDAAGTFGRIYAYVDLTTGNDGTGVASTTAATTAASPYATISAAAAAIQTLSNSTFSRNNIGNHEIRLRAGTYLGFHGSSNTMSSRAVGDVWLTITRDPDTTSSAADVVFGAVGTAALKTGAKRVKYSEISVLGNTGSSSLDNQQAASLGNFLYETWFDRCNIEGAGTQRCINRFGLQWYTNCAFTTPGPNFGNDTRSALKLLAGCTITGAFASTGLQACNGMGNIWTGGASMMTFDAATWAEGTGVQTPLQMSVWMFNSWYRQGGTVKFHNGTTATQYVGRSATWACNVTEIYSVGGLVSGKGGEHSADSVVRPIPRLIEMWNTIAGEGLNVVYNENGANSAANVAKRGLLGFNCWMDLNIKADFYDASPEQWSQYRVGNWRTRYHVSNHKNALFAPTDTAPSLSNLSGEYFPADWLIGVAAGSGGTDPVWTDDQSWTAPSGAKAGNGDYRPTTTSPHKGMVSAAEQMFPEDFGGAARKTDGTGCPGAFEWA